jgi:hypothetical protein
MRFILVNGRTPCPQSSCVLCCEPIGTSYLREIGTRLSYCDHNCYADHCRSAVLVPEHRRYRTVEDNGCETRPQRLSITTDKHIRGDLT